jgi:hypothetical protein
MLLLVMLLAAMGMACAQQEDEPEAAPTEAAGLALELGDVPDSVEGNVVTLPVEVSGVEIKAADGDESGDSGHFHVFVDQDPVDEGELVPMERGIVHSAENPVKVWGLEPGEHEFTVVVGDGTHKRIHEELSDSVTVDVEGPSVRGSIEAPTLEEGEDLEISLESDDVEIVAADNERSEESGHFHVLVDPETPPTAGMVVPPAVENEIIHTAESSTTITGLEKGAHVIWVVLGDGQHYAFDPPVMDRLAVTVQ